MSHLIAVEALDWVSLAINPRMILPAARTVIVFIPLLVFLRGSLSLSLVYVTTSVASLSMKVLVFLGVITLGSFISLIVVVVGYSLVLPMDVSLNLLYPIMIGSSVVDFI